MSRGYKALRKGRASIAGQIYLVTFTTHARIRHFADPRVALDACALMTASEAWHGNQLLAWVLMPDHWHGLVQLGEGASLSTCIGRLKGATARALRLHHPELCQIWGDGFHDHALRRDKDLLPVARYIVLNPVRAGLVRRIGNYPFWDAAWL
jgi:REP element-mobilizing transposase RayT